MLIVYEKILHVREGAAWLHLMLLRHFRLCSVVKVPILQHLESLRDEELEERREKRRRQLAEEEESKQNERRASGAEQTREQSLQVNN